LLVLRTAVGADSARVMIRVGDILMLSLWDEAGAVAEIGQVGRGEGFSLITHVAGR